MSGLILEAARFAKSKFGARVYVERGSRHIVSQARILEQTGGQTPSRVAIERELASYKLADKIAVASGQVVDSFLEEDPASRQSSSKTLMASILNNFRKERPFPLARRPSCSWEAGHIAKAPMCCQRLWNSFPRRG